MNKLILILPILIALTAQGCSMAPGQPSLHDFDKGQEKAGLRTQRTPNISVAAPRWLQDNRIRYRLLYSEPTRVRFYSMNRWIAPPAELLEQQFKFDLPDSNGYLAVTLLEFEQQFISSDQSKAVIRLYAEAYTSDRSRQIGAQEFRLEQWTITPNAEGAVNAFSNLAPKASEQIRNWLNRMVLKP